MMMIIRLPTGFYLTINWKTKQKTKQKINNTNLKG